MDPLKAVIECFHPTFRNEFAEILVAELRNDTNIVPSLTKIALLCVLDKIRGKDLVERAKQVLDSGVIVNHRELRLFGGNEQVFQLLFSRTYNENNGLPVVRNDGITTQVSFHLRETVATFEDREMKRACSIVFSLMQKKWNVIQVDLLRAENVLAQVRFLIFENKLRERGKETVEEYGITTYAHPPDQAGAFFVNKTFIQDVLTRPSTSDV